MKQILCDLFGFGCASPYSYAASSQKFAGIASVPEINAASGTAALAVVAAALFLVRELSLRGAD